METDSSYWDQWHAAALAAGVPAHLAQLGREVMRDLGQHGADASISLGAEDDGPLLIDMMLLAPISAESRLAQDQMSRQGFGDALYELVDQVIARRLGVATAALDDLRNSESAGVNQAYQADAMRRPQNYGPKYKD